MTPGRQSATVQINYAETFNAFLTLIYVNHSHHRRLYLRSTPYEIPLTQKKVS